MKKIFVISILLFGTCVNAAYVCPSTQEVQDKMTYYQQAATEKKSMDEINALSKDLDSYLDNLFTGCLGYLKTAPSPDCDRLSSLLTGYMLLPNEKGSDAKKQLKNLVPQLKKVCPTYVKPFEDYIK